MALVRLINTIIHLMILGQCCELYEVLKLELDAHFVLKDNIQLNNILDLSCACVYHAIINGM